MNDSPLFGLSQRQPPVAIEAEQGVLGSILANNKWAVTVEGALKPEHFADPVNGRLYGIIMARIRAGDAVDIVTLQSDITNSAILDAVGGVAYLTQLLVAMPHPSVTPAYAKAITESWGRRQLIGAAEDVINDSFSTNDLEGVLSRLRTATGAVENAVLGAGRRRPVHILEAADRAFDLADDVANGRATLGLMTGMPSVDAVLNGLEAGHMLVLGGRPGAGKSALALDWAIHTARQGIPVVIFSLEMPAVDLARRALAMLAGVSAEKIKKGQIMPHIDALMRARQQLADMPLEIEDAGRASMAEISASARGVKQKHGRLGLVVIDHLHIVKPDEAEAKGNPTAAITGISHDGKAMAKSLECPVMLLAQMSRAVTGRDDHRPQLSDLRQAGAIEEDADQVVFVHREELFISKTEPHRRDGEKEDKHAERVRMWRDSREHNAGKAQLLIEKNRGGETASITLEFIAHTTTFIDPASQEQADMGWPT